MDDSGAVSLSEQIKALNDQMQALVGIPSQLASTNTLVSSLRSQVGQSNASQASQSVGATVPGSQSPTPSLGLTYIASISVANGTGSGTMPWTTFKTTQIPANAEFVILQAYGSGTGSILARANSAGQQFTIYLNAGFTAFFPLPWGNGSMQWEKTGTVSNWAINLIGYIG